jgi:hypothetical protein
MLFALEPLTALSLGRTASRAQVNHFNCDAPPFDVNPANLRTKAPAQLSPELNLNETLRAIEFSWSHIPAAGPRSCSELYQNSELSRISGSAARS